MDIVHVGGHGAVDRGHRDAAASRSRQAAAPEPPVPHTACSAGSSRALLADRALVGRRARRSPAACRRAIHPGLSLAPFAGHRLRPRAAGEDRPVRRRSWRSVRPSARRIIPALRGAAAGARRPAAPGVLLRRALRAEVILLAGVLAATAVLVGIAAAGRAGRRAGPPGPYSAGRGHRAAAAADHDRPGAGRAQPDPHLPGHGRTGAPFTGSKELRVEHGAAVEGHRAAARRRSARAVPGTGS